MNVGEWWFRSGGEGWYPGLYEWFFRNTRRGVALRAREEELVYEMLATLLEPDDSVVEFGSGTGNYTVSLARRCVGLVAIEVSEEMHGYLREPEGHTMVGRIRADAFSRLDLRLDPAAAGAPSS